MTHYAIASTKVSCIGTLTFSLLNTFCSVTFRFFDDCWEMSANGSRDIRVPSTFWLGGLLRCWSLQSLRTQVKVAELFNYHLPELSMAFWEAFHLVMFTSQQYLKVDQCSVQTMRETARDPGLLLQYGSIRCYTLWCDLVFRSAMLEQVVEICPLAWSFWCTNNLLFHAANMPFY